MDLWRSLFLNGVVADSRKKRAKAAPKIEVRPIRLAEPKPGPVDEALPTNDSAVLKVLQTYLKSQPDAEEKERPEPKEEVVLANAPLERRSDVAGSDRLNYRRNFTEQHRLERGEAISRESEFAASLRGHFWRWPITRWLFNRKTRRVEVLIVCGLVTAIVGVLLSILLSKREMTLASSPVTEIVEPIHDMGDELLEGREASAAAITKFFQATSMAEVTPLIRNPDALASIMTRWYDQHEHRQESDIEFDSVRIKELLGARYYLHFVRLKDDTDTRPIAVEETADGYLIDWETAVGYQSVDWQELQKQCPSETVYMRVIAKVDDYFNYEFGDSAQWSCFRLIHPDGDNALYGYVKRYSELDREMRDGMGEDELSSDYFILGIRYPMKSQSGNLVHIEEILQNKWVRSYNESVPHFDER
ncbi:MAG: hypothetical protein ACI8T1_002814 [Verrucomicrobiales bacterium]